MTIWAYTFGFAAALLAASIRGALLLGASLPRAIGKTDYELMPKRDRGLLFLAVLAACLPVLTLASLTFGALSEAEVTVLVSGAGVAVFAAAFLLPVRWLGAVRPRRIWVAAGVLACTGLAIGARFAQDEALYRGALPCFDLPTNDQIARCRAEFARSWRIPDTLLTH